MFLVLALVLVFALPSPWNVVGAPLRRPSWCRDRLWQRRSSQKGRDRRREPGGRKGGRGDRSRLAPTGRVRVQGSGSSALARSRAGHARGTAIDGSVRRARRRGPIITPWDDVSPYDWGFSRRMTSTPATEAAEPQRAPGHCPSAIPRGAGGGWSRWSPGSSGCAVVVVLNLLGIDVSGWFDGPLGPDQGHPDGLHRRRADLPDGPDGPRRVSYYGS